MTRHRDFTPADDAIFLAATTVGNAESFLGGRSDAGTLYANALKLSFDLGEIEKHGDLASKSIIDLSRLLLISMVNASAVKDAARLDRWREVMAALCKLVRLEVIGLREAGVIGDPHAREKLLAELADLEAKNAAATSWGAAVGARHERIKGIRSQLARMRPTDWKQDQPETPRLPKSEAER